jgi:ADP-ribose pyrophosphatase YjhB (NUDIX family)
MFGRVRRLCRYCGFIHFREPKVAVAALVSQGDRVLLVRRAVPPQAGYWALPAGYMDADETPEEALIREVREETGIVVQVTGLHGLAPLAGWAERRGILLIFRATAGQGDPLPHDDVTEARWVARPEIPWEALAFESTATLLHEWAERAPG